MMIDAEIKVSECISNTITIWQERRQTNKIHQYIKSLNSKLRENIDVRRSIAYFWLENNEHEKAAREYKRLCKDEPGQPLNWLNYCASQRALKKSYKALNIIKQALMIHPENKKLGYAFMQCLAEKGKLKAAQKIVERELEECSNKDEQLVYGLQFVGEGYKIADKNKLRILSRNWEQTKTDASFQNIWADHIRTPCSTRKIRIGYFSQDLCDHPVGRFIKPIIKDHDRRDYSLLHRY